MMWFRLAASRGFEPASRQVRELEKKMSPRQLESARRLAAERERRIRDFDAAAPRPPATAGPGTE
jgi:hypothetical protein